MENNKISILVVDDEVKIVEVLKSYLEKSEYVIHEAHNGKDALALFDEIHPSLIILDLMLPDISGEDVCRKIRQKSRVPIIMLTAKAAEENIIEGLDIGADDYVTKPFSPKQVLARVTALLRRTAEDAMPIFNTFNDNELYIDYLKHEVRKNSKLVSLTPNEYKLLMTMVKYPSRTFSRGELVKLAFGDDYEGYDRTIDTYIKNLRQKIETDSRNPKYILTVHGFGYRFGVK